jgi:hypothetical protein
VIFKINNNYSCLLEFLTEEKNVLFSDSNQEWTLIKLVVSWRSCYKQRGGLQLWQWLISITDEFKGGILRQKIGRARRERCAARFTSGR